MDEIYPVQKRVLGTILSDRARAHGDRAFLRFDDRTLSYAELDQIANVVATNFAALDVGKGDTVCVMLPNSPEFLFCTFGLARLGAIEVPINTAYKGRLLNYVVANSDARVLVIHEQWLDRIAAVIDKLPNLRHILVHGGDTSASYPQLGEARVKPYEDLLEGKGSPPQIEVKHSDIQAIMYTSGTTGPSKGVMVSHCHALTFAYDWLKSTAYEENDILYTPLPLFHAIAHTLGVFAVLLVGSEACIADRFRTGQFWEDVRRYDATVCHGIFGMVPVLLNQPPAADDRNHRLRAFYIGASAASDAFEERFGAKVVEVYGATETGVVTCAPYGEALAGSCGLANTDTFDVLIVDDEDNELPPGDVGEIAVRPRVPFGMMSGYYKMEEATLEAYRNLWFHTGDYGRRDENGYFFFVDRKKDAIRRRGENISSYEVEQAVNGHPAVLETAAIAVPSEVSEDEVKVCVVRQSEGSVTEEELIKYLDGELPYFMVPRYVEFMDELPKTPNEKVEKYKLRQVGREGITESTWDREEHGIVLTR